MKQPSVTTIKKYLTAISKIKAKYITPEKLSKFVGIYPDIIQETLSYFDPLLNMDPEYNLLELVQPMKKYIVDQEENKIKPVHKPSVTKKTLDEYDSVADFIYKKLTIAGGIVNKNAELSDTDLRILKRLVNEEQAKRKKK